MSSPSAVGSSRSPSRPTSPTRPARSTPTSAANEPRPTTAHHHRTGVQSHQGHRRREPQPRLHPRPGSRQDPTAACLRLRRPEPPHARRLRTAHHPKRQLHPAPHSQAAPHESDGAPPRRHHRAEPPQPGTIPPDCPHPGLAPPGVGPAASETAQPQPNHPAFADSASHADRPAAPKRREPARTTHQGHSEPASVKQRPSLP